MARKTFQNFRNNCIGAWVAKVYPSRITDGLQMRLNCCLILALAAVGCSAGNGKNSNGRETEGASLDGDLQAQKAGSNGPDGKDSPDGLTHPDSFAGGSPVTIMGTNLCSTSVDGSVSYVATAPKGFTIVDLKTQATVTGFASVVTNKGAIGRIFHPGDAAVKAVVVSLKDEKGKVSDIVVEPTSKPSPNVAVLGFESSGGPVLGKMHILQVSDVENKMFDVGSTTISNILQGTDSFLFSFGKGRSVSYSAVTMQFRGGGQANNDDPSSDLIGMRWTEESGFGPRVVLEADRHPQFVAASGGSSSIITASSTNNYGASPPAPGAISHQVTKFDGESLGGRVVLRSFPYVDATPSGVFGNITGLGAPDGSYFGLNVTQNGYLNSAGGIGSGFVRGWVIATNTDIVAQSEVDVGYDYVTRTGGYMSGSAVARDGYVYAVGVISIDAPPAYGSTVQIVRVAPSGERRVIAERHFQSYLGAPPRLLAGWTAVGGEPDLSLVWFAQGPSSGGSASLYRIRGGQFVDDTELDPSLNVDELRGKCQIAAGVDGLNRPNLIILRQGLYHYGDPNMGRSALVHFVVSKTATGYKVIRKQIPAAFFSGNLRCISNNLALGKDSPFDFAPQSTDPRN